MLGYFLSPAKADLLPTDGGSSARSDPPWLRACCSADIVRRQAPVLQPITSRCVVVISLTLCYVGIQSSRVSLGVCIGISCPVSSRLCLTKFHSRYTMFFPSLTFLHLLQRTEYKYVQDWDAAYGELGIHLHGILRSAPKSSLPVMSPTHCVCYLQYCTRITGVSAQCPLEQNYVVRWDFNRALVAPTGCAKKVTSLSTTAV